MNITFKVDLILYLIIIYYPINKVKQISWNAVALLEVVFQALANPH